jgi:hypothetical protein
MSPNLSIKTRQNTKGKRGRRDKKRRNLGNWNKTLFINALGYRHNPSRTVTATWAVPKKKNNIQYVAILLIFIWLVALSISKTIR